MTRWISMAFLLLGATTLGCSQATETSADTTEAVSGVSAAHATPTARADVANESAEGYAGDPQDGSCPFLRQKKLQQAAGEGCACGERCGCDEQACACAKAGEDGSCGCTGAAEATCPYAKPDGEASQARLDGVCPFLASEAERNKRTGANEGVAL